MTPEFLIAFAVGVFVGSFGYRVWRNGRRDADQRPLAGLVRAGAMSPNEERLTRGANVNPPPDYPRPPAPPGPPPMADMVGYPGTVCMEHYYGGCPNCGRGYQRAPRGGRVQPPPRNP